MVFLDSGGYEASKDTDLSDLREREHVPALWKPEFYKETVTSWRSSVPTVLISYDHPTHRIPIAEQIREAKDFFPKYPDFIREILLKPDTSTRHFLDVQSIVHNVHALAEFEIVGITEKEIGSSILNRMENIARIRSALHSAGLSQPIHVFGSLDTITTFFYFVAGADIFDGLTWLRFGFKDGHTLYKQNYGALMLGIGTKAHVIESRCWFNNYYYISDMQLQMRRYLSTHEFSSFKHHATEVEAAYNSVIESIGGGNGGR